ncbi:MAG: nucleotidyltransferase family protein [Nanoarchaeota archaeon]|nr:nucleotidyltransferase family protein [Nanoarchaeota archaeon]
MDNNTLLKTLAKIKQEADKRSIDFWVMGGLAYAFHVGRIYREHSDLDLIVRKPEDHENFCNLLTSLGFSKIKKKQLTENLTNSVFADKNNVEVDIGPFIGEFGMTLDDFEEEERELEGTKCKVLSKRFLQAFKEYLITQRSNEKDLIDIYYLK